MALNVQPNFHRAGQTVIRDFSPSDDFYQMLLDCHHDLTYAESTQVNANLVLLLANHIGDLDVIKVALQIARQAIEPQPPSP